jgi:hypothetical protein
MMDGDKVSFVLPQELTPPTNSSAMNCTGVTNVQNLTCSINGTTITVELTKLSASTGAFSWTISNIKNPASTLTSSSFTNIKVSDKNNYLALVLKPTLITVTNQQPAMIQTYSIV